MVPLTVRSNYSFGLGGSTLDALIARAKTLSFPALAIADVDSMAGAPEFFAAAKREGITPLIGAELDRIVILTTSRLGYANLCTLLSRKLLGSPCDWREFQSDLWFLTGDPATAARLRPQVDRLAFEIVPGRHVEPPKGLPLVASPRAHVATPGDLRALHVLTAIKNLSTMENVSVDPDRHLRRLEPDFPDISDRIAADCAWDFLPAPVTFPSYPLAPGETAFSMLYALCHAGLHKRYHPVTAAALARLSTELAVIQKLGFSEYFLVVHDIVRHARVSGAPIAGRGSGASSLVAYVLGITNVCPLAYHLPFERFLHEGRKDFPDLDLDFCWRTRDSVIDYAFERFGRANVAMVSSMITFQSRAAFREAAKAHGLSDEQITLLKRTVPMEYDGPIGAVSPRWKRRLPIDPGRFDAILADATRIFGFPHYFSVHPGGIVIGRDRIERYTPVQMAKKEIAPACPEGGPPGASRGVVISQFDKDGVEAAGLVKIDLLGNRGVSTLRASADLARVDPDAIPDLDPATSRLVSEGRTVGVNQLESPAMRHLVRMMKPRGVADVMKALALIRPGAASGGGKERFVARHRGLESWSVHPLLAPILSDTYGVMIYEDDTMLVASTLAGLPLADGDRFRKRVQKTRTDAERLALSREFLEKCVKAGTPVEFAKELWVQMAKFNEYSFCMSHAASYARLAWAVAWMKAHRPLEFWCAALNNNQGMYEKRVYVDEARRDGVATRLPDLNRSGAEFAISDGTLLMGLDLVHGLSQETIAAILRERPFASLWDFLSRAGPSLPEAVSLIQAGALDFLGRPRTSLVMEATASLRAKRPVAAPALPDEPEIDRLRREFEITGIAARAHLMEILAPGLERDGCVATSELPLLVGRRVRVAGVLDAMRLVDTQLSSGDRWRGQWKAWQERGGPSAGTMEFVTLEDEHGLVECTLFPKVYDRFAMVVRGYGPYVAEGVVEDQLGAVTLNVEAIRFAALAAPSRRPAIGHGRSRNAGTRKGLA
jgi:DNA polymerase-3 subunit alpha/error-prone DNA polymerase